MENIQNIHISEICKEFNITTRTLRFWEKEMPEILNSKRDGFNMRIYDHNNYMMIKKIIQMKKTGLTIKAIGKILAGNQEITSTISDSMHSGHQNTILTIRARLQNILERIEMFNAMH